MPFPAPRPAIFTRPTRQWQAVFTPLMLGAAIASLPAMAPAQSIGDWNGAYRTAPAKNEKQSPAPSPSSLPAPRINAAPVIPASPAPARVHASQRHARTPARVQTSTVRKHTPPPVHAAPQATASPRNEPTPTPTPTAAPPQPAKPAPVMPKPSPRPLAARPSSPPAQRNLPQWPLGLAAVLGAVAGWALWRRRKAPAHPEAGQEAAPLAQPIPQAPPIADPRAVDMAPPPAPAPISPLPALVLDFTPTRFATTLTEAILRYRVTVTNHGPQALGPLVITGTMMPAGADQDMPPAAQPPAMPEPTPSERPFRPAPGFNPHPHFTPHTELSGQTAPPAQNEPGDPPAIASSAPLPELHRLTILRTGEGADFSGQIRLPLAQITPIRVGSAALFVPLVRMTVAAEPISGEGPPITVQLCAMVGEVAPETGSAPAAGSLPSLGPLRLDADAASALHLGMRALPWPAPG